MPTFVSYINNLSEHMTMEIIKTFPEFFSTNSYMYCPPNQTHLPLKTNAYRYGFIIPNKGHHHSIRPIQFQEGFYIHKKPRQYIICKIHSFK